MKILSHVQLGHGVNKSWGLSSRYSQVKKKFTMWCVALSFWSPGQDQRSSSLVFTGVTWHDFVCMQRAEIHYKVTDKRKDVWFLLSCFCLSSSSSSSPPSYTSASPPADSNGRGIKKDGGHIWDPYSPHLLLIPSFYVWCSTLRSLNKSSVLGSLIALPP